jgi:hypothetical protein
VAESQGTAKAEIGAEFDCGQRVHPLRDRPARKQVHPAPA